ncbi:protein ORD isoform X1 [Drosophila gunungcola]|uniref:Protein ORD n=1 Tax=Drosophila gunungcola TaxID=103775 RepID=A0A9Q0BN82_9MUSC|nr:protein ORD isoform X1 [Drosophila gunungcola]KAI8037654.1 hypothetical protein M5D96_009824 [Drosophila gunungcola]
MSKGTAINKNHKLHIISLDINDCLGCDKLHVEFSRADNVHVIIYDLDTELPNDLSAVTPVAQAILLLSSLTYPDGESVSKVPQLKVGRGSVSMTFEMAPSEQVEEVQSDLDETPCTSRQAERRLTARMQRKREASLRIIQQQTIQVTVERRFDDLTLLGSVSYRINGDQPHILTVPEFHAMFFVRPQYSHNFLWDLHQKCAGNWLKVILSDADGDAFSSYKDPENPFKTFAKLFYRRPMEPQDFFSKLAKTCVHVNEAVRLSERKFVLQVFDQVCRIFEYITFYEYTVWFLVPRLNNIEQLRPSTLEDFDLTKVRTSIRATGDTSNIYWDHTDHNIKDILMVAFQLALATNVNQSVLVISHLETLSQFITMQYVTASFMNDLHVKKRSDPKWFCHRYLQRIVEKALFMGTIVIIEYPSSFTQLEEGRQLIKCFPKKRKGSSRALQWEIFEDVVRDNESSLQFLKEATNQLAI